MGLLKTNQIKYKDLDFKYKVYINKTGEFSTTLPDNITKLLDECGIVLGRNRLGRLGYIHTATLTDLESEVKRLIDEFYSEELIKEEEVILYCISIGASYCKGKDDFVPNGGWATKEVGDYDWMDGTYFSSAASPTATNLSIYAEVKVKLTYKFKNGREFIKYKSIASAYRTKDAPDYNKMWLAGLCSQAIPRGAVEELQATEENCAFFVGMFKYIYYVNENLKAFVAPAELQGLIRSKKMLLTPAKENNL